MKKLGIDALGLGNCSGLGCFKERDSTAIVNDDKRPSANETTRKGTTRVRFNFLEKQLRDPSKNITVEIIKSLLSSHEGSICVHNTHQPGRSRTFGSLLCHYRLLRSYTSPPDRHARMNGDVINSIIRESTLTATTFSVRVLHGN